MSEMLADIGIVVSQPYAEANLSPHPDLVVIGNALSRGNVEVEYVLDQRLPYTSMAALVHEEFLRGREVLTVAGTHGKTTTTSMLSWIFHVAGRQPSFLIGGIAENFGSSFAVTEGREFILEGDEYDTAFFDKGPKFMHYFPDGVILTSVEFDHADIYRSLDEVKTAFKRLVNLVPRRGRVIAWDEQGSASGSHQGGSVGECVSRAFCTVERYGFAEGSAWRIRDVRYGPRSTTWRVERHGQSWAEFDFELAGEYNVLNATAAAALAAGYGIDAATIGDALRSFRSVKRRLEVRPEVAGITIIDDFAHHPTAIAETLKALRTRYPHRRLWAILEPRSNSLARNLFQQELASSLRFADEAIIADVYRAAKYSDSERLDVDAVVRMLSGQGLPARHMPDADAIVAAITSELRAGDVVAILSNGGFGDIYEKLPKALRMRFQS